MNLKHPATNSINIRWAVPRVLARKLHTNEKKNARWIAGMRQTTGTVFRAIIWTLKDCSLAKITKY